MRKQFEETECHTLMKNVRFFKRTKTLYNAILDSNYNKEIEEDVQTANQITDFIHCLVDTALSINNVKELQEDLYSANFMLMRTIVLHVTEEKRSDDVDLQSVAEYIQSEVFHDWIEEDESRRAIVAGYCLLVNSSKGNPSVQQAFQQVNGYLKDFFENDSPVLHMQHQLKAELVLAARNLLQVCMDNTEDEDNREDVLLEFGFEKIFKCFCEDLVERSVKHKKTRKVFNFFWITWE